jgi:hypothetical protein
MLEFFVFCLILLIFLTLNPKFLKNYPKLDPKFCLNPKPDPNNFLKTRNPTRHLDFTRGNPGTQWVSPVEKEDIALEEKERPFVKRKENKRNGQ